MRTKLLLTGTIVALAAGVYAIPSVLIGTDEPIPTGQEATVEAARTALQTGIDFNGGLRFTRLVCTADGGAMVVFESRGLLSSGGAMAALNEVASDPSRWWGGMSSPDDPDAVAFLAHHPPTDCD